MNILAVGAHWDDIELGCSLTLKKLGEKGHKIFTVVVCSSQYGKNEDEGMNEDNALEYGLKSFGMMGANYIPTEKEPNSKLVYGKKIMQELEEIASNNKIDGVFTHWFGDLNTDNNKLNIKNSEPICILIGPEGDFTINEREKILKLKNIIPLKINNNILRAETAAISMISITAFKLLS